MNELEMLFKSCHFRHKFMVTYKKNSPSSTSSCWAQNIKIKYAKIEDVLKKYSIHVLKNCFSL